MATRRTSDTTRSPKPAGAGPQVPTSAKTQPEASAAKPEPAKPRVSRPKVSKPAAAGAAAVVPQVSEETRRAMIAESAYLRAERRGFAPGYEVEDWCAAEREVDALLRAKPGIAAQ
jgi:DUF2934 family protein